MAHVVRTRFGLSEIVGRGHLDGWFPRFMVGHQEFLFYGPGYTWLVGLVRLASFGVLSDEGAVKAVTIASLAALGPAVAFVARSFGLSRRAAGIAAVLSLAVNNPFGVGISSVFVIGLLPHQVAAIWFCLALGGAVRVARGDRGWSAFTVAVTTALLLTHLISTVILALVLLIALPLVVGRGLGDAMPRLAKLAAGAAALSAFWLIPFLAHRAERGSVTTWATPPLVDRVSAILRGEILFAPRVGWVVVAGLVAGVALGWRRRRLLALAVTPPAYLVIAHGSHSLWPGNEITLQLANRGLGIVGLLALLPLAAVLAEIPAAATRILNRSLHAQRAGGPMTVQRSGGLAGALVLLAAALVGMPAAQARQQVRQQPSVAAEMTAMARRLAEVVPDGARFATERDFPGEISRTGVSHPDLWLAARSGRNTLNIFNLESSPAPRAGYEAERIDVDRPGLTAGALARMGVTHLVTVKRATAAALDRYPAAFYFGRDSRLGTLALFRVVPVEGRPGPETLMSASQAGDVSARLLQATPEHLMWRIRQARPDWVTLAIGWSPKWRARLDGERLRTERAPDGLLRVRLTGDAGQLDLRFQRDGADSLGAVISASTLLLWGWGRRRRRGQSSSPRMSSSFSRTA